MARIERLSVAKSKLLHSIYSFYLKKERSHLGFPLLSNRMGSPPSLFIDCVYTFPSHTPLVVVGLLWLLELMNFSLGKMGFKEEFRNSKTHSFHNNTDVATQIDILNFCFL